MNQNKNRQSDKDKNMTPTQELEKVEKVEGGGYRYSLRSPLTPPMRELKQSIASCHWEHQSRMIKDILGLVCLSERQFENVKSRALGIIHAQDRAMAALIDHFLELEFGENDDEPTA